MRESIVIDTGCGQVDVPLLEPGFNRCNCHSDCEAADRESRASGWAGVMHCRDPRCGYRQHRCGARYMGEN